MSRPTQLSTSLEPFLLERVNVGLLKMLHQPDPRAELTRFPDRELSLTAIMSLSLVIVSGHHVSLAGIVTGLPQKRLEYDAFPLPFPVTRD